MWSSGGGCLGLNYTSIDFLFRLYKVRKRIDTFEALQLMEYTAIKILSEQDRE